MGSIDVIYCTTCNVSARLSTGGGFSQKYFKDSNIQRADSICACDSCKALKIVPQPHSMLWGLGEREEKRVELKCPDCGEAVRVIYSGLRTGVLGRCPVCDGDLVLSDTFVLWD